MLQKTLIVSFGFLGLFLAGMAAGPATASAGYACGPWNAWCGRAFWLQPGWGHGWRGDYDRHHWRKSHSYKHWDKDWHKGKRKHHAHKGKHWKKYD